jgi:hypothetical protein
MRLLCITLSLLGLLTGLTAQEKPTLSYYLPVSLTHAVCYDAAIPTPAAFLGYEVGEWHVSHDQLVAYMRELDRVSERIQLREYGRSHERRPLVCLTITAPANQSRIEEIRLDRLRLADPDRSGSLRPEDMPGVVYMGYSIHGNEASGSNAALVMAYFFAAAQNREIDDLLQNTVILFDPCFNPDGLQRFSSWVNGRRSLNGSPDPAADEFNEPWPRGRTNHYWFDLNRDWLVMQQPESSGRVRILHDWKPNVLTDHHEMGSNSTFFFQPGVPSRVNPLTPARNQELTARIATYHADVLSRHGIQFYSGENYDDFYYGKGSTYPDVNGGIGILFEQASSRGSAQQTENGLLTFPFTVRNQVFTSFSTFRAVQALRVDLNGYLQDFYRTALEEARRDPGQGFLFSAPADDRAAAEFLQCLGAHRIRCEATGKAVEAGGKTFEAGSIFVPLEQPQYRLIQAIFGRPTTFSDSIFYDISAWTLPDAMGLEWTPVRKGEIKGDWTGEAAPLGQQPLGIRLNPPADSSYAFGLSGQFYELPRVLAELQRAGLRVKVALKSFQAGQPFSAGSLIIPAENQPLDGAAIKSLLLGTGTAGPFLFSIDVGLTDNGPDLGSANFATLRPPKVLLLTGEGVNPADAGEIWHLLDTRYGLPVTLLDQGRFGSVSLADYNVLILPDGAFGRLPVDRLREFVSGGGTLIATGASLRWLKTSGLVNLEFRSAAGTADGGRRTYGSLSEDRAAHSLSGAIFEARLDLTHPLCFGYARDRLPMFLNDTIFIETAKNPYAMPAVFTESPLLAGYIHPKQKAQVSGAAAIVVGSIGRGRVICFAGNPNFRGFWYGTNRLFANAVWFGNLISAEATERK